MANLRDDIARLEMAAQMMMAPPNQVSAEHRREAEKIFLDFRGNVVSFDLYRQILETSQNHYVMFEVAKVFAQAVIRQWHSLTEENIIGICQYIIQLMVTKSSLPNFVVAELLHSLAIILKRASVDTEILDSDFLANAIESLIRSEDERLQSLGLQAIEAIASEFSTSWRSGEHVALSCDFNTRAKKHFENVLLKNFLKLSLSTLSQLLAHSDFSSPAHLRICDKFLRVAFIVFSWNFSQKLAAIRLRALATIIKTSSFRPPVTWSDFFQDASIVTFFAQLHARVRQNEDLAVSSLNCMAQMASVMGEVLGPSVDDYTASNNVDGLHASPTTSRHGDRRTHDIYVQTFASNLIDLFTQLHDYEMLPLSLVIYKLFTYHPVVVFKRFPAELMGSYVMFLAQKIITLTGPAMDAAILKNEQIYHEALHNLYQVWRNLVRNSAIFSEEVVTLISIQNIAIVEAFLKSVLSPPYGTRKELSEDEIREESEYDEDDREMFADLLCDVGYFSLFTLDSCTNYTLKVLDDRVCQFRSLGSNGQVLFPSVEEIRHWQEDMHWLFLFVGHQFQHGSFDCISNLPEQMAQRCLSGYRSGEYERVDFANFIAHSLEHPFDTEFAIEKLDPVTKLSWYIFSWSVLEHNALVSLSNVVRSDISALISPELTRSSLWLTVRLLGALSPRDDGIGNLTFADVNSALTSGGGGDMTLANARERNANDAKLLPHIPLVFSDLLSRIIEFLLSKVFIVLSKMPGDKKLCADAVQLIVFFADYRADALARSEHLYEMLAHVDLVNLPSRRPLIKSLVVVGSMVTAEELRDKMYKTILAPLEAKFTALCALNKDDQSVAGQLVDLFDCFTGIAEAGQSDAASLLFAFLKPVFRSSSNLLLKYPESQLLLNAMLDFYFVVADVLFFYIESSEDCGTFHENLLSLFNVYRHTQTSKYQTVAATSDASHQLLNGTMDDLEYQTKDLCTLMEILCHALSKTFMPTYDGAGSVENSAKMAIYGLEIILPLMDEELLKIPTVCATFFRLLLYVTDLAPHVIAQISTSVNSALMHALNLALDNVYGVDRTKCALEIVSNLATHFHNVIALTTATTSMPKDEPLPLIAEPLAALLPKVFNAALQNGTDSDLFAEASNATYALFCLNKDGFLDYIGKLMEKPENARNGTKIHDAFRVLVHFNRNDEQPLEVSRIEKRIFRERFEKFVTDTYGLLCL